MKPKDIFRNAYNKAIYAPYRGKFSKGDVIMNKEYGVVSLVVDIIFGHDYRLGKMIENSHVKYELKDIKNEKSQKDITKKPSRYQECKIIDAFYEQIDPQMARLLYGVE